MKKFDVYLFDFDGTLFDSLPSSKYVFKEAYKTVGVDINESDVITYTRIPIPESFKALGCNPSKWQEFIITIDGLVNSQKSTELTDIYDDTYETIIDLKTHEATLGIVTSNNIGHVQDVLKKFSLKGFYFDVLIGNREAPNPKPNPEPILKALEKISIKGNPDNVCYVGDSLNDVKAAINAKVQPILLDRLNEYSDSNEYIRIKSLIDLI